MHEKFIARQPIFDKRLRVYAYELLFRGGPQNFFQPRNHAASSVIADSLTLFDLQTLTGHARAFINVDELAGVAGKSLRSEEHTSELQSLTNLVCRLLLEKKKTEC